MRDNSSDYRDIFLNDRPMMDARAPVEFHKGAFPGVVNLPLMTDLERERVGTCYKQQGQQAAIVLGHQLVSGAIRAERIHAWAEFARANPRGYLYCFRGGLRSQIVQQWLRDEAGIEYPRVAGGYKAMRTFLLSTVDAAVAECDFVLLGGMTGTGKTEVLHRLDNGRKIIIADDNLSRSLGRIRASQPHRHPDVSRRQRRRIVHRQGGQQHLLALQGGIGVVAALHVGAEEAGEVDALAAGGIHPVVGDQQLDIGVGNAHKGSSFHHF